MIDGHAVDRLPHLFRVSVDKAHRHIPGAGIAEELIRQGRAHIARPYDGHLYLIDLAQGVALNGFIGVFIAVCIQKLIAVPAQQRHQQDGHGHDCVHADAQIHREPDPAHQHQYQV